MVPRIQPAGPPEWVKPSQQFRPRLLALFSGGSDRPSFYGKLYPGTVTQSAAEGTGCGGFS